MIRITQAWAREVQCINYYHRELVSMVEQCLRGELHGLGDRLRCQVAIPFLDDRLPRHSFGNLLQNISDEDARATKCRLSMSDSRIHDKIPAERHQL
jgi:hypothetical protein